MRIFEVFEVKAEGGNISSRIVEDIEVESNEAWQEALDSDVMKPVSKQWQDYGDESSIETICIEKIG